MNYPGIFPSTPYCVCVRLRNDADYSDSTTDETGWSKFSEPVLFRTLDAPPSKPGPAVMFSTTNSSITLEWTAPKYKNGSPLMQYDIQYALSPETDQLQTEGQPVHLAKLRWIRVFQKIYVTR